MQKSNYEKGKSRAYRTDIIADIKNPNLNESFEKFYDDYEKTKLCIKVMSNVLLNDNYFLEMKVSTLIQCVEGCYKFILKKSEPLKKTHSLNDCLIDAFEMNIFTKMIWDRINKRKGFIRKSINTRNQFSHMEVKKVTFEIVEESIKAMGIYSLLLRVMILSNCNVKLDDRAIESLLDSFEKDKIF